MVQYTLLVHAGSIIFLWISITPIGIFFTTCYPTQIITLSFVPAEHASFHVYHPHFDINYFGTSLSFQTWWKIEHSHISLLPLSRQADVLFNGSHAFNQPFWCFLNFSNCFCLVFIVGLDSLLSVYIYICVSIQYVCSTYFLIYITSSLNMSSYKYTTLCISWHRYTCDNMMTVTSIRPWEFDRFFFHVRNMTTLLRSGQKQRRNILWKNSLSWPPPLVTWLGSTFGHSVMVNTQHVTMSWMMMMIPTLLQMWYKSQ